MKQPALMNNGCILISNNDHPTSRKEINMETLNSPILALLILAAFLTLCWYSQTKTEPAGYSASDRQALQRLVDTSKPLTRQERQNRDITALYGEGAQ
jgi:hypothetical protein